MVSHELGENHFRLFLAENAGAVGELQLDRIGEAWRDDGMVAAIESKLNSIRYLVRPSVAARLKRQVANARSRRILKRERELQREG